MTKLHVANRWEKAKNTNSEDAKNCSIYVVYEGKDWKRWTYFCNKVTPR